jgi:hypothetical protein
VSLKTFHLFFIGVSIVLALWLGAWGLRDYVDGVGGGGRLGLGLLFFVVGFVLVIYWFRFREKYRHLDDEDRG